MDTLMYTFREIENDFYKHELSRDAFFIWDPSNFPSIERSNIILFDMPHCVTNFNIDYDSLGGDFRRCKITITLDLVSYNYHDDKVSVEFNSYCDMRHICFVDKNSKLYEGENLGCQYYNMQNLSMNVQVSNYLNLY